MTKTPITIAIALVAFLVGRDAGSAEGDLPPAPVPTPAEAATPPTRLGTVTPEHGSEKAVGFGWGDGRTSKGSEPIETPAVGSTYAWRQMGLGLVIMAMMVGFIVWLVRRNSRVAPGTPAK